MNGDFWLFGGEGYTTTSAGGQFVVAGFFFFFFFFHSNERKKKQQDISMTYGSTVELLTHGLGFMEWMVFIRMVIKEWWSCEIDCFSPFCVSQELMESKA
jgi:hypothetical protein